MKCFIITVFTGAVVAQLWGTISWIALPWHNMDYKQFTDEQAVIETMRDNMQGNGIYLLPNFSEEAHESEHAMQEWTDKAAEGPFAFMSIRPDGVDPGMGKPMTIGFLTNLSIAAMLFWLLVNCSITGVKGRTLFLAVAGGVGGVYPHLSQWSWWRFPTIYSFAGAIDLFVTWGIAGFVMVLLCGKFGSSNREGATS